MAAWIKDHEEWLLLSVTVVAMFVMAAAIALSLAGVKS